MRMPLTHIKVAKDLQELTLHGSKEFPVALYETKMSMDSMIFYRFIGIKKFNLYISKVDVLSIG